MGGIQLARYQYLAIFYWIIHSNAIGALPFRTFEAGLVGSHVELILELPLVFGMAMCLMLWLVTLVPGLRGRYDRYAAAHHDLPFRGIRTWATLIAIGSTAVSALFSPFEIFDQFCLTPRNILEQTSPWSGLRPYSWDKVKRLTTFC